MKDVIYIAYLPVGDNETPRPVVISDSSVLSARKHGWTVVRYIKQEELEPAPMLARRPVSGAEEEVSPSAGEIDPRDVI